MSLLQVRGATVVVTGTFEGMSRAEVTAALEGLGARVTGSVSSRTAYLFAGAKAGGKVSKAKALGVEIVGADELAALLDARPDPDAREIIEGMVGAKVVVTGSFSVLGRERLVSILEASGAQIAADGEVPEDTTDVVSGDRWDDAPLRGAMALGARVWTEGQILLALGDLDPVDYPYPEDVPHGERLDALEPVETGETAVSTPQGVEGRLMLRWKKVCFEVPLRFSELYGFAFHAPEFSYVGRFYLDGEALAPESGGAAESFAALHFKEDGSDDDDFDDCFEYEGAHGFNCTGLALDGPLDFKWSRVGGKKFRAEYSVDHPWFGLTTSFPEDGEIFIDFEASTWGVRHSTGPHKIDPDRPWGDER